MSDIRGRKTLNWYFKKGLYQLSPEVQRLLIDSTDQFTFSLSRVQQKRLERLASMDALAAQIIYLRIADSRGEREKAFEIGHSIYRTMLIMCTCFPYFNLRQVLITLMGVYVFPLAINGLKRILINDENQFACEVVQLKNFLLYMDDSELVGDDPQDWHRVASELLQKGAIRSC